MQNKPEGPDIHLLEVQLEQIFRQNDVLLHLGCVVVEAGLELPQLLLDFVRHQQRLPQHDLVTVHV